MLSNIRTKTSFLVRIGIAAPKKSIRLKYDFTNIVN